MTASGPGPVHTSPQTPVYAPVRILMLHLTVACNLRCTYCYQEKEPRRMSGETLRRSVEWFLSRNISGAERQIALVFYGGECMLELDRIEEAIAIAREYRPNTYKQVTFSATTNGTVAGPRVERLLRDGQMSLLISVDGGPAASRHRPMASGKPSYDLVARNLPQLVSWASDAVVRTTFHPEALDLADNVRHVLDLGAPAVALCPVEEAGWEGHEGALEAAYQALADWYLAEARQGRILPLEMTHMLLRQYHAVKRGAGRPARPCGVGTSLISVTPEGNVMPCHRFLYRPQDWLGHVSKDILPEARLQYVHLSSRDFLGCDTCTAEPVCGGGCRATALGAGLSLHQAFAGHCITMRAHARAAHRIYQTLTAEGNTAFGWMLAAPRFRSAPFEELIAR